MRIFFIDGRQLRRMIVFFMLAVFITGAVVNWDRIARKIFGVKPGVKIEGHLVQGMLPDEVARLVKALAVQLDRQPVNAGYFPETGEIIPARPGRIVRVAENVKMVCTAGPGEALQVMMDAVPPAISEDYFRAVYRGNPETPHVALAINVAWGEEHLQEILKTLAEERAKATFFFVGTWVKLFPELVRDIAAGGHELANHGLYHGHPTQMNRTELKRLINENQELIASISGHKPVNFFAPPYGELNTQVISVAGEMGYRTIMWTVDSVDWKNPAPEIMRERILSKVEPGAILLFHPTVVTKTTLRGIIKELRAKGLEPGTVSGVLTPGPASPPTEPGKTPVPTTPGKSQ